MNFSFTLKGKDWVGLYLAAFLFYFVPTIGLHVFSKSMQHNPHNVASLLYFFGIFILMLLALLMLVTPILKKFINSTSLNGKRLLYSGSGTNFILMNIGGIALSIVTLAIYSPWYMARVWRYIIDNSSYENSNLSFNGKGGRLFLLLLATVVLPMILASIVLGLVAKGLETQTMFAIVSQVITLFIMLPYIYCVYKWMFDFSYKNYAIYWETETIPSIGKIFVEVALTIVTLGIYYPAAIAKLYEYFMNRTIIVKEQNTVYTFNVDFNCFQVWKTVWIQLLLTIVTCGIYGAWAYCKCTEVFVNNTSIVKADPV